LQTFAGADPASIDLDEKGFHRLLNIDLPWNPSRLEQQTGRVQHIDRARDNVRVLSSRYAATVEDQVYAAFSQRFDDIFSVLGQLPDDLEAR
jgi:hypothetical protein